MLEVTLARRPVDRAVAPPTRKERPYAAGRSAPRPAPGVPPGAHPRAGLRLLLGRHLRERPASPWTSEIVPVTDYPVPGLRLARVYYTGWAGHASAPGGSCPPTTCPAPGRTEAPGDDLLPRLRREQGRRRPLPGLGAARLLRPGRGYPWAVRREHRPPGLPRRPRHGAT